MYLLLSTNVQQLVLHPPPCGFIHQKGWNVLPCFSCLLWQQVILQDYGLVELGGLLPVITALPQVRWLTSSSQRPIEECFLNRQKCLVSPQVWYSPAASVRVGEMRIITTWWELGEGESHAACEAEKARRPCVWPAVKMLVKGAWV